METAGVRLGLENLSPYIKDKNIKIAHDHDGATSNIIKEKSSQKISESLDPGHATQEIKRKANNHLEEIARSMKEKGNPQRNTIKKCFARSASTQ